MDKQDKIYVAGHTGLVGSAIYRNLKARGYNNIVTRSHTELDLTNQAAVQAFFEGERPDCVLLCAAKVGGDSCQFHVPGAVHLRKPGHPDQCGPCGNASWC